MATRFRLLLIALIVWFAFLFNIERPDVLGLGNLDLSSFVYIIAAVASVVVIFLPDAQQFRIEWLLGVVILCYAGIKVGQIEADQRHASLLIVMAEVAVLVATVLFSRLVSRAVGNFEKVVENVVLMPDTLRVLSAVDGEEKINNELFRARRYERPVSILLIRVPAIQMLENRLLRHFRMELALQQRYLQGRVAQVIGMVVYRSDIAARYQDGFILCLPETDDEQARTFAGEIYNMLQFRLSIKVEIGLAVFPEDGLIFQDLVQAALRNPIRFDDDNDPTLGPDDIIYSEMSDSDEDLDEQSETESKVSIWNRVTQSLNALSEVIPSLDVIPPTVNNPSANSPDFWVYRIPYISATSRAIYQAVKRTIDLILVFGILPFALPVMGVIALAIYLENRGPIFFVQERTGMGGHRFKMYKFRSMVTDAEQQLINLAQQGLVTLDRNNRLAEPLKMERDPRVTRVGRILRKTSLDELPQLFNVLKGDMSVVGPRPTSWDLDSYTLMQTERLSVRPGITGLWQVCGRGATDFNLWLKWDIIYIDKMSFTLDVIIMWRTVSQVLSSRGAR